MRTSRTFSGFTITNCGSSGTFRKIMSNSWKKQPFCLLRLLHCQVRMDAPELPRVWWPEATYLSLVPALRNSCQLHARERRLHPTRLPSSSFHLVRSNIPVNCLYYSGFRCDKRLAHWHIMSYFILVKEVTVTITTQNNYNANGSLQVRQEGQSQLLT